jgi:hypothetical protein
MKTRPHEKSAKRCTRCGEPRATLPAEGKAGKLGFWIHAKCRDEANGAPPRPKKKPPSTFAEYQDPSLPLGMRPIAELDEPPESFEEDEDAPQLDEAERRELEGMGAQSGAAWAGRRA